MAEKSKIIGKDEGGMEIHHPTEPWHRSHGHAYDYVNCEHHCPEHHEKWTHRMPAGKTCKHNIVATCTDCMSKPFQWHGERSEENKKANGLTPEKEAVARRVAKQIKEGTWPPHNKVEKSLRLGEQVSRHPDGTEDNQGDDWHHYKHDLIDEDNGHEVGRVYVSHHPKSGHLHVDMLRSHVPGRSLATAVKDAQRVYNPKKVTAYRITGTHDSINPIKRIRPAGNIEKVVKSMAKETAGQKKVHKVMHEFKEGELHSGSKEGPKVESRDQAIAIALSEKRKKEKGKKKVKKSDMGIDTSCNHTCPHCNLGWSHQLAAGISKCYSSLYSTEGCPARFDPDHNVLEGVVVRKQKMHHKSLRRGTWIQRSR